MRERIIALYELLIRIHWNQEFRRGEFAIGYYNLVQQQSACVLPKEAHHKSGCHFCFNATDERSITINNILCHRINEERQDGALIWRRWS